MKKSNNILKHPIMIVVYRLIFIALDKLFGKYLDRGFWYYCVQGLAFATAMLLGGLAQKHLPVASTFDSTITPSPTPVHAGNLHSEGQMIVLFSP